MSLLDRITLKQLRALRALADHGTVTAAAKAISLTAPAVHIQLKNLEEISGTPLVDRESREGGLTPQGHAMLRAHDQIEAAITRALAEVEALNAGTCGNLTLGVVTTCKYFAPEIVALLAQDMPDVTIALKIGNRSELMQGLERGEYDLCIMGRPPREPLVGARSLAPHPHVLIARPDHPLAGRNDIRPVDLVDERFVMREPGSGTRILAERFLSDVAEKKQAATIEMSSNETIKQAVISGLGIALISGHTVAYELQMKRLVTLNVVGLPILRTWYVITPRDVPLSIVAQRVREWLLENAARFLPALDTEARL
ncbi:LysR family transcriptional regulator [Paracoccus onubensis]|uniref:HTH-type transcriptional regulator CbbR n=1 Tax=Paracoccus onubensis TaxID=1675788 RepID=A0A418SWL4_9RHOB|nr:LysR family transcriptional regulator [Paracoccus onubensis]RJE85301.1 LysR family transcriptional regulator [Paracoccus onubensis]